jgi:hypothetical protein
MSFELIDTNEQKADIKVVGVGVVVEIMQLST